MKKLVLSALLLAVASQAAGCIIVSDDDDTGNADVGWALLSADNNGNPVPTQCPTAAPTATIFAQRIGIDAVPFEDRYDCVAGGGLAADLPEGRYTIWVRLSDDALTTRYAESGSQVVDVFAGETAIVPDFTIYPEHAFFLVGWQLRTPGTSTNTTCAQYPQENGMSIDATDAGGSNLGFETIEDCERGEGGQQIDTRPLPLYIGDRPTSWSINLALLDANDAALIKADPISPGEYSPLTYGNQFGDLGVVLVDRQP